MRITIFLLMIMGMGLYALEPITMTIALKQNNVNILKKLLADRADPFSKNYGQWLSREEILNIVSPNVNDKNEVINWLNSYGVTDIIDYNDAIKFTTDKANVEKLLSIKINRIQIGINYYHVTDDVYIIPDRIKTKISFISGLLKDSKHVRKLLTAKHNKLIVTHGNDHKSSVNEGYAAREAVAKLYNIPNKYIKYNSSVGAAEYLGYGGFSQNDLYKSQSLNGIPNNTVKHAINNLGISQGESELDMDMISQTAANADLWYRETDTWLLDFAIEYFNAEQSSDIISMSWGWAESEQCSIISCGNITDEEYVKRVNIEYAKIGLLGKTLVAASGDAGAPGRAYEICVADHPVNPVFPTSSPYITSVSASFVLNEDKSNIIDWKTPICRKYKCVTGTQEMATNYNYTFWTAGGGFGIYSDEDTPKWQQKEVSNYLSSGVYIPKTANIKGRAYPDVMVIGHNCPTVMHNNLVSIDGTSCSSPIFAGILAILNDHQISRGRPKIGFVNPLLYKMYQTDASTFTDINIGFNWCTEYKCCPTLSKNASNYGYVATKGYDPVSGLGTPNVDRMLAWLDKYT